MSCYVKGCRSTKRLQDPDISFHRIPKDNIQWHKALKIDINNWKWSSNALVCSKHFRSSDYEPLKANNPKKFLKKDAVPSLLLESDNMDTSIASTSTEGVSDIKYRKLLEKNIKPWTIGQNQSTSSSTTDSISRELNPPRTTRKRRCNADSSSSSPSSGSKRRRREGHLRFIKTIHSYSISPTKALQNQVLLKAKQRQYRKKLYDARKKVKKLEKEVQSMKTVVKYLEDKNNISNNGLAHVNQTIDSVPNLLMSRYLKNIKNNTVTHESYPAPLRRFAATLQFYSCRAYEEVRSAFALALPSQATIRKWYTNIDCNPGYIDTTFEILEKKCQSSNYEVICSLMIDEMSIKKQIETDGQKTWGYVDIGVPIDNDQLLPATQVLAVMVVAQNSQWKLPIAYFLIHSLTGADKANIITESLIRLHKVGVKITSVTCDGPNGNFTMFKLLGCNFEDPRNMKAYFLHPETSEKIFCIFDPCHMLKLVRNNFCELKELMDPSKKQVKWELLEKLHKIQKEETLNVANKLKNAHIQWKNQKMKVALAAQTLSRSVADALKFLRLDLEHPDFLESEATENFIYLIDQLFDCLNSRSPFAKGLKGPIRENNEKIWRPFLIQAKDYLLGCTEVHTGRPLYMTGKKTPFIGFAITIDAIFGIFQDYVVSKRLNYLLTFKMSQDHLETFFCALRCRNGWNNNPTALQFMYSFRRLLLHTRVAGRGGNCRVLDSTVVLSLPSTSGKSEAPVDLSLMRRYNLEANTAVLEDHDYDCTTTFLPLSVYSTNVVAYMGGYVVKMLEKRRLCTNCLTEGALADSSEATGQSYMLIARKNRGGLKVPSPSLIKICQESEVNIRKLMELTGNKVPTDIGFQKSFVLFISQKFYEKADRLFPNLKNHFLEGAIFEENHCFLLIKSIVDCYCRIRFFNLLKKFTEHIQGAAIRKKLSRLIIFNNQ